MLDTLLAMEKGTIPTLKNLDSTESDGFVNIYLGRFLRIRHNLYDLCHISSRKTQLAVVWLGLSQNQVQYEFNP